MLLYPLATDTLIFSLIVAATSASLVTWRRRRWARVLGSASKPLRILKTRWRAWCYLFWGTGMIQSGYDHANSQPYEIHAPDNRYIFVTSSKHIKELDTAPDTVLSLQAASKQMLQPKYTMHGFSWFDRRGTEGVGFVRALRTLLTNNMPNILPNLGIAIKSNLIRLLEMHPTVKGSRHSPVYPMIVQLTVLTNAMAFFGQELARNEEFMHAALDFIEDTLKTAEIVRLLPKAISPLIGNLLAKRLSSHEAVYIALMAVTEQRLQEKTLKELGQKIEKHDDCIEWIMETAPRQNPWSAQRIVHELMAIWFGSVHALSTTITFAIHDLCLHPEYVEPLRQELSSPQYAAFEQQGQGLPLLDSFIKESARLTPVESSMPLSSPDLSSYTNHNPSIMSTRRHALQPFTLSDGTRLEVGDWACTPVRALMQNPEHYPEPLKFNGFRFADPEILKKAADAGFGRKTMQKCPSKLTDVNDRDCSWHVWGTGRMACPGRFYAAAVIKVMLAQIILGYDCELVDKDASRWFTWRSSMLPRAKTMVIFRFRGGEEH